MGGVAAGWSDGKLQLGLILSVTGSRMLGTARSLAPAPILFLVRVLCNLYRLPFLFKVNLSLSYEYCSSLSAKAQDVKIGSIQTFCRISKHGRGAGR